MSNRDIHLSNLMKLHKALVAAGLVLPDNYTDGERLHIFNELLGGVE